MATVLITGGTGLIGKALTKMLLSAGHEVIILTRKKTKPPLKSSCLTYAFWNISHQQIDKEALKKADYIIHLAGAGVMDKKWTEKYKQEMVDSRVNSSTLLIKALKNTSHKIKAIVAASAIGWYGEDLQPIRSFTEDDPPDNGFLGETCRLWEKSMEPVRELGIRLINYRIGIVLSNNGGALSEFKKPLRFGIAGILGDGQQIISWIHIEDLCRLFIYALENENIEGIYNAVAPNPVSNKSLLLCLANTMRGKFYIPLHIPSFILKLILGSQSIEVLKSTTVSSGKIENTGFHFLYSDIKTALLYLKYKKEKGEN